MNPFDFLPVIDEGLFRYVSLSKGYDVTLNQIKAGHELPTHTHDTDVLNYVIEGEFTVEQKGVTTTHGRGEWIFIGAGVPHSVRANSKCLLLELWKKP